MAASEAAAAAVAAAVAAAADDPLHVDIAAATGSPLALLRDSFGGARQQQLQHPYSHNSESDDYRERSVLVLRNVHAWRDHGFGGIALDVHICSGTVINLSFSDYEGTDYRDHIEGPVAAVIDCRGGWLLPGLCDAHVHSTAVTADLAGLRSLPESLVTAGAAQVLGGMLLRGFTTVRDAGGADWGLAQAVEEGKVLGPRILFTGGWVGGGWRGDAVARLAVLWLVEQSLFVTDIHPPQPRPQHNPRARALTDGWAW